MSIINTNGIDVSYPVPGINNDSQGFRTNFASIKNNLNVAGAEITDLQNNAITKVALANSVIDNNMRGTLISNALTRSFSATTFNLGNALSGLVVIDVSRGDVQYGSIAGNVTLQFAGWSPVGTQSNVELQLTVANTEAILSFPTEIYNSAIANNCLGITTIENMVVSGNIATVAAPYGVCQLDYRLSSIDCGNTITIEPYNRPRRTTEIRQRTPAATGFPGDTTGAIATSSVTGAINCTNTTVTTNVITCDNTSPLSLDMPIVFSGVTFGNAIVAGNTYYVRNIPDSTTFTISSTPGTASGPAAVIALDTTSGNMTVTPVSYLYVASAPYDSTAIPMTPLYANVGNTVTMVATTGLVENAPIVFSGSSFGVVAVNTVYYVANISGANVKLSTSRHNGIAGQQMAILTNTAANGTTATCYVGTSIWKKLPLQNM